MLDWRLRQLNAGWTRERDILPPNNSLFSSLLLKQTCERTKERTKDQQIELQVSSSHLQRTHHLALSTQDLSRIPFYRLLDAHSFFSTDFIAANSRSSCERRERETGAHIHTPPEKERPRQSAQGQRSGGGDVNKNKQKLVTWLRVRCDERSTNARTFLLLFL